MCHGNFEKNWLVIDDTIATLMISTQEKIQLVKNEIVLDVFLARKKRGTKKMASLPGGQKLFHIYI